jgi:hypothetical protein
MKYIKELKDEYPIDFFGIKGNKEPNEGMLYFVERRWFNISWFPVRWSKTEVYKVVNGRWVRGRER